MRFTIVVLAILVYYNNIIDDTTCQTTKDQRPFYQDPLFSVIEPNIEKHRTAGYGDYRYFDMNYVYTINLDFYRYGITERPDYDVDPSTLTHFIHNKKSLAQYWAHYKHYYRIALGLADGYHFNIFKINLRLLNNLSREDPMANFRINPFLHLTYEEFIGNFTGFDSTYSDDESDAYVDSYEMDINAYPRQLDWSVYKNSSTLQPKNQEGCRNSFVYSAIHNLEIKLLIDAHSTSDQDMQYMSIQQGWDCSDPRIECDEFGGQPHFVFRGLMESSLGVQLHKQEFDFHIWTNLSCEWHDEVEDENSTARVAAIEDWGLISVNDELELVMALNEYGPLSTAIFVSNEIKNYHSGIMSDKGCGTNPANHAVLLTGYGIDDEGTPYWIIKNSWGTRWGENGFLFLIRNKAACGIGRYLAYVYVRSITTTTTTTIPTTTTTPTTQCDLRITECDMR